MRKLQGRAWEMVILIGGSVPEPCVRGWAIQRQSIWYVGLSCLSRSSNQINQID